MEFVELKDKSAYNVIIGDDVMGRFTLLNPLNKLPTLEWEEKGKTVKMEIQKIYKYKNFEINPITHKCFLKGKEIYLSPLEFRMVHLFASRPNEFISLDDLLELWDSVPLSNTLLVHTKNLRNKGFTMIETIRGIGYRFVI